jgi:putative glutamine amidotransferase
MSKSKPVIGITGDFRPAKKDAGALSWFNTGYYDSVTAAGGLPVLIPPHSNDKDLKQALEMCDGLVTAGCTLDLDPVRLGMDRHPSTRTMPPRREDFDRRVTKMAVDMQMPILAIGAGMQTLNVVCGGTLHQHIAEALPKPLHHRDPVESTLRHVIDIVPGTRVDKIYGPGEIRVNSQHHMAVAEVAEPFKVSATCPDGVIEAIESTDEDWYCLGVQWHPENESASALDMQVFENFLEACVDAATVRAEDDEPVILPMTRRAAA